MFGGCFSCLKCGSIDINQQSTPTTNSGEKTKRKEDAKKDGELPLPPIDPAPRKIMQFNAILFFLRYNESLQTHIQILLQKWI